MSFEGYNQHICFYGHFYEVEALKEASEGVQPCPYCKSEAVFTNGVDNTNGDQWGTLREEDLERFKVAVGSDGKSLYHLTEHKWSKLRALRKYYDKDSDRWVPCRDSGDKR